MKSAIAIVTVSASLAACGGIVQFEPGGEGGEGGGGDGGNGGTSTSAPSSTESVSANQSSSQSQSSSSANTTVSSVNAGGSASTGPATDCVSACTILYACGLEDGNCPGFTGEAAQQAAFSAGCVEGCEETPVVISLIDGSDCAQTVSTLKGVSVEFAEVCEFGL